METKKFFNSLTQVALPTLTISSQIAIALKYPQWGLIIMLISQPFWLYSSWKSYKDAGQVGILITTAILTFITILGIINYWFL